MEAVDQVPLILTFPILLLVSSCSAPGPLPPAQKATQDGARTAAATRAARTESKPASVPAAAPAGDPDDPKNPPVPQSQPAAAGEDLGPALLLPSGAGDDEVDRLWERPIRKHEVYDRFVELEPLRAAEVRELVAMDLMVARDAAAAGITVPRSEVDTVVAGELARVKRRFETELAARMTFVQFLAREFGLDEEGYRARVFRSVARARLRERTVRFTSWRQERVSCRFLVTSDQKLAEEVRKKVVAGADLEVLARKHSEDESRDSGGRLPPFGPDFSHPVAEIAFRLEEGGCSPVVTKSEGGRVRHYVVHCLRRIPARTGSFHDLEKEIVRDLEVSPMTTFESTAYYLTRRRMAVAPPPENR